jgi:hypothetical protein
MRLRNVNAEEFFDDHLLQIQIKFQFFDDKVQIVSYWLIFVKLLNKKNPVSIASNKVILYIWLHYFNCFTL